MSPEKIEKLMQLIAELVNETGSPWKEKRDAFLSECSDDDKSSLFEFVSWFSDEVT
jgi:hypothetical protein